MNKFNPADFDLDIFINFAEFNLHFATAGGSIDPKLAFNSYHAKFRSIIKSSDYPFEFNYKLNPGLDEIIANKSINEDNKPQRFNREAYLKDFIGYAKKGLFSFDRTAITDSSNRLYHLVAYPIFDESYIDFLRFNLELIDSNSYYKYHSNYNSLNSRISDIINSYFQKPFENPLF